MRCPLSDLIKQVVERNAEDKDLKNLSHVLGNNLLELLIGLPYRIHIAHVASINEAARLQKGESVIILYIELIEDLADGPITVRGRNSVERGRAYLDWNTCCCCVF